MAFVPERLRGKAEVNQETLQRVRGGSRGGLGEEGGGSGAERALTALCACVSVCALAAGGERPAGALHRGVPEQGPGDRLRAVSGDGAGG